MHIILPQKFRSVHIYLKIKWTSDLFDTISKWLNLTYSEVYAKTKEKLTMGKKKKKIKK